MFEHLKTLLLTTCECLKMFLAFIGLVLLSGTIFGFLLGLRAHSIFHGVIAGNITVVGILGLGVLYRAYLYLKGTRNCETGIRCGACHRIAFPVEGTDTRYHCWSCGARFEGPAHF